MRCLQQVCGSPTVKCKMGKVLQLISTQNLGCWLNKQHEESLSKLRFTESKANCNYRSYVQKFINASVCFHAIQLLFSIRVKNKI